MIDRNFTAEFLDPVLWGRLGEILSVVSPETKVLHVMEADGAVRTVIDGCLKVLPKENAESADDLRDLFPEADEIRVYTPATAEKFLTDIQEGRTYNADTFEYLNTMYAKLQKRVKVIPVRKKRNRLWEFLERQRSTDGICNIGITKEKELYFHCILEFKNGNLTRVTTSDRYKKDLYNWEKICENVEREFPGKVCHYFRELEALKN